MTPMPSATKENSFKAWKKIEMLAGVSNNGISIVYRFFLTRVESF